MSIFSKLIKLPNKLNMKFFDPLMESEYLTIHNKNQNIDFKATMIVLVVVTLVTTARSLIELNMEEFEISTGMIGVFFFLSVLKNCFSKKLNYIILLAILCYNLYRLFFLLIVYDKRTKATFFSSGYTYAVLQMVLLSRIHNAYYRIAGVVFCYLLRFGLIIGMIEKSTFDIPTLIRNIIVDIFLIYYFHSQEQTSRRIFQDYCDEKDELIKFRELLDDYLPQCVTVVDFSVDRPLFSNKTFLSAFGRWHNESCTPTIQSEKILLDAEPQKLDCGLLEVDQSTIKEIGMPYRNYSHLTVSGSLRDVVLSLTVNNLIWEKTFTMTAHCKTEVETKSFEIIVKRVRWDRSNAISIILNDTTAQEKVMALKLANQNKDKIIATVSHELRTPLNGIIGLLSMAEEKAVRPDVIKYISLSRDNAQLLLSLVNSHLDLQQIGAGKLRLNPSRIDIAKSLNDIIQLLQFQTKQKGIYLQADISKDILRSIITDENRLKQILINLIGNAIKFTSVGGIKVEICQDQDDTRCLQISVVDTGMGIKNEDMGKLFQMYGSLEEGRSVNKNGVGLGLMISNVLARVLSGRSEEKGIEVKSIYGTGSSFCFKIRKNLRSLLESETQQAETQEKEILKRKDSADLDDDESHMPESVYGEFSEGILLPLNMKVPSYASVQMINLSNMHSGQKILRTDTLEAYAPDHTNLLRNLDITAYSLETKDLKNSKHPKDINNEKLFQLSISNNTHSNLKDECIIVVDDNPFNLMVIENQIKDIRYPLKTASGGYEAIELIKTCVLEGQLIKVILMDCQMPIIDGYSTSLILKGLMDEGKIPVIPIFALSAGIAEEDIKKCFDSGMRSYLTKPLSKEVLIKELSQI